MEKAMHNFTAKLKERGAKEWATEATTNVAFGEVYRVLVVLSICSRLRTGGVDAWNKVKVDIMTLSKIIL